MYSEDLENIPPLKGKGALLQSQGTTSPRPSGRGATIASSRRQVTQSPRSLKDDLSAGVRTGAIVFAGQGMPCLDRLGELVAENPNLAEYVEAADHAAASLMADQRFRWNPCFAQGFSIGNWLRDPETRPSEGYLTSTAISQALIFTTQIATYQCLLDDGLNGAMAKGHLDILTGHSQGMMSALLIAESPGGQIDLNRFQDYVQYFLWQGFHMARAYAGATSIDGTSASPMAAISGIRSPRLEQVLSCFNKGQPDSALVTISLYNTGSRVVVSGPPRRLMALKLALEAQGEKESALKKKGQFAGSSLSFTWEDLIVGGPFHGPHMAPGLQGMMEAVEELGFHIDGSDLKRTVLSPADGRPFNGLKDLTSELVRAQFIRPVRWQTTLQALVDTKTIDVILDLGPGDGVARLTRAALRGRQAQVIAVDRVDERPGLFRPFQPEKSGLDYGDFAPCLVRLPNGRVEVETAYTRITGQPPVILAGMTPTTVDVPIVAAAANGGFTAELAGGGQVSEAIFKLRMEELEGALEPGQEIVFNALFLDPYLWELHLGTKALVQKARQGGAPIRGVTISAGVPELDQAVQLIRSLNALGMAHNAFKPGTLGQVEQVLAIAKAVPEFPIFMHLEGGKAGGHHSWEDLEELLLGSYHAIRRQPNVVLCAGGGIGTPKRAYQYLSGAWAKAHGEGIMPVDAVFLGTVAMACAEATASSQVKEALVQAGGTEGWVNTGAVEGGVTSGQSQLGADIHYLDNAAARCGRLLDAVAGDEAAVQKRRGEIILALNRSAKPYFGDLDGMTWAQCLDRMVELMAVGTGGRYEDGPWPDVTYRQRMIDMVLRGEARLQPSVEPFKAQFAEEAAYDDPKGLIGAFKQAYPQATETLLHPADQAYFLESICARPGKPVCFIPVIDSNVRRWYKADSLWQAQDPRYTADQVLIIPGPEALAGLDRANEPVADLLERFVDGTRQALLDEGASPTPVDFLQSTPAQGTPPGLRIHHDGDALGLRVSQALPAPQLLEAASGFCSGPLSYCLVAPTILVGSAHRPNPLRTLCLGDVGARMALETVDGDLRSMVYRPASGGERLSLSRAGNLAVLEILGEDGAPRWSLSLNILTPKGAPSFQTSQGDYGAAIQRLYLLAQGLDAPTQGDIFTPSEGVAAMDTLRAQAYRALTGLTPQGPLPLCGAFSMALPFIFAILCRDTLAPGLLDLLHLSNTIDCRDAWSEDPGSQTHVDCRLVRIEDSAQGRQLTTCAILSRGGLEVARVRSDFLMRGDYSGSPFALRERENTEETLHLEGEAEWRFLNDHKWLSIDVPIADLRGGSITLRGSLNSDHSRGGDARAWGEGECLRDGAVIGRYHLDAPIKGGSIHPIAALATCLSKGEAATATPPLTLSSTRDHAPRECGPFAEVSGDLNPLHTSPLIPRLAGFTGPIVHGMWTAARLHSALVEGPANGDEKRISHYQTQFLAPIPPGAALELTLTRTHREAGSLWIEGVASLIGEGGALRPAVKARALVAPAPTALVFPGQGIQQQAMGMDGYKRSPAARAVWERADAFTRDTLGFSILYIVRENPKVLQVKDVEFRHPQGLLNMTQFTQVAMAVLAQAQVAELKAKEALPSGAYTCGHSVGEYNALSAFVGVLPLEDVIDIVYQRGLVMHHLVERDAEGKSPYRMGVVRPHYAGLDHAGAEALVESIAEETGAFIQIVNYNIRDRQYSVTGHHVALLALEQALNARQLPNGKPPFVLVPGIDVPFHSRLLLNGVESFRRTLQARFPDPMDPTPLVDRYIPNLYPVPFSLGQDYAKAVADLTDSPVLMERVDGWMNLDEATRGRTLLIELLAYQFASPVRWIETQELMLAPKGQGGLSLERILEVGVGYQPTLSNMAKYSLQLMGMGGAGVEVLNVEAQRARVFAEDRDPEPEVVEVAEAHEVSKAPAPGPAEPPAPAFVSGSPSPSGPAPVLPFTHKDALYGLLALQAKVRPEELKDDETIDALFDGVSSRRNQVLLDIGAEFGVGAMDGAHERPLATLADELKAQAPRYQGPGAYLSEAWENALKASIGRGGMRRRDVETHLEESLGLGDGLKAHVLQALATETRSGVSARGGALGTVATQGVASPGDARDAVMEAAAYVGQRLGVDLTPRSQAQGGGTVDSGALKALREEITGPEGVLMTAAKHMAEALGHRAPEASIDNEAEALDARLARIEAEHGAGYEGWLTPAFEATKHVLFDDRWASAQEDIASLCYDVMAGRISEGEGVKRARRLRGMTSSLRGRLTARYMSSRFVSQGFKEFASALDSLAEASIEPPLLESLTKPALVQSPGGQPMGQEIPTEDIKGHLSRLWPQGCAPRLSIGEGGAFTDTFKEVLFSALESPLPFAGRTALVTGAGPGSIAMEVLRHLLAGGARVIVTTSSYRPERVDAYGEVYRSCAGAGAELHVLPFNQGSFEDVDALVHWLFNGLSEQAGAGTRVIKEPFHPDIVIPFGALSEGATLDKLGARSMAAMRIHLHGVERLIASIGRAHIERGSAARPCHVILPLSPNHGAFGGDGTYAETKAALEVLLQKWSSEGDAWAKGTTLCGARIGWVRGTGLMESHDAVAAELEARCGVATFSSQEMGLFLAALAGEAARRAASNTPLVADLTGGFGEVGDIGAVVGDIRMALARGAQTEAQIDALRAQERALLGEAEENIHTLTPLPRWIGEVQAAPLQSPWPSHGLTPKDMIVIVGMGEVGPWGSARTRFDVECEGGLSDAGVMELAWMCGHIRYEQARGKGAWVDTESGEAVAEHAIPGVYRERVEATSGIRIIDGDTLGFNPGKLPVYSTIYLEKDLTFPVSNRAEAETFLNADPKNTRLTWDGAKETWNVTRLAGTEIRVPKVVKASRRVLGAIPDGFDFSVFGITPDMIERIDRLSLFNLVATVDAFISAGLSPEELMSRVHPTRVGNTQGSGIGGMASLHRLYTDHILGEERHSDVLQETLINVIAAYVVQSYVGSYGVMSHPVGACATAAVSVEEAVDKILLKKADLVVAGGFDDVGREGLIGFSDMAATADTDQMLAMGIPPERMSRSNDRRRRGFVEAQGGGTVLLARGDVALDLGLEVLGVVAYAASFGDGIHSSIPAPGLGALGAARGAEDSPLGHALRRYGLTADDIALVYKHDTSTQANDPNEASLHDRIQEALGRHPGNPLWAVSQKTLTGHPKGGAAAWQLNGMCQSLVSGIIPGNRNLECVDPAMASFERITPTRRTLRVGHGLRGGLITSLGFGHVSAMILALHPEAFAGSLSDDEREAWEARVKARKQRSLSQWAKVRMGSEAAFEKRRHRRFKAESGDALEADEAQMLLDADARFDRDLGHFVTGTSQ